MTPRRNRRMRCRISPSHRMHRESRRIGAGEAGFSFVEMLIAMTLLALLSILAMTLLTSSYRQSRRMVDEFDLRSDGLEFLRVLETGAGKQRFHSGLLAAETVNVSETAESLTLSFADRSKNTVTYTFEDGKITLQRGTGSGDPPVTVLEDVRRFHVCGHALGGNDQSDAGQTLRVELHLERDGPPRRKVELTTEAYVRNASRGDIEVVPCE